MLTVTCRLMIPSDAAQARRIDAACYPTPFAWDVYHTERGKGIIVRVAEYGHRCLVGVLIYRGGEARAEVLRLGVDPAFRREGVARQLLEHLVESSRAVERRLVSATIPETDLASLRTFRAAGFGSSRLIRQASGPDYIAMACVLGAVVVVGGEGV